MKIDRNSAWAVIGAGMGGKGFLAHLATDGFRVRIHDIDENVIAPIRAVGGVKRSGTHEGLAPAEFATTDLARAVDGAAVIIVCTYGTDHDRVAVGLAPLLRDGQIVLLVQGHFLGAHLFRTMLARAGCTAKVAVAEMDSYPYMVGILAPDTVKMATVKATWQLSASPASRTSEVLAQIAFAFPGMVAAASPLHTAFADLGAIFHVAGIVTNVGNVENSDPYNFYAANMVPSVCRLIEALDAERVAVARAYGVNVQDVRNWLAETYGLRHERLNESMQEMARTHYAYAPAPKTLDHRYLAQDVSCGVLGVDTLGEIAGIRTPVSHAAVQIACALTGRDFFAEGRNARKLGFVGMTSDQVVSAVSA